MNYARVSRSPAQWSEQADENSIFPWGREFMDAGRLEKKARNPYSWMNTMV